MVQPCGEDGEGYDCPESLCRECAATRSVGRLLKRWIDTLKECLKKRGLNIRQARRMVQDRNEWREFVRGNTWGVSRGMNP